MSLENEVPLGLHARSMGWKLFESSRDCVKLLSSDGRVLAMNENGLCAMEIDDFSRFKGSPWKALWPLESHSEIEAAITTAVRGETGQFKAFCPTAKGSPRWWEVIITSVADPQNAGISLLAVSRDITEKHLVQTELKASEGRLRSLIAAISAIVWNCSANGLFEKQQVAWASFTGQRFEQYLGRGWLDAVHPDDRVATETAWSFAIANSSFYQVQHRLLRADGEYRHMSVKGVPIIDVSGVVIEWMGVHTDITHHINAEAERERLLREVQAANDRMQDIFRQAPAFMCVLTGPDHVFDMINERYLQLVGNRNLIGQPVRSALPEVAGQGFFDLLDRVYRTGEPFFGTNMPVMLQRKSGSPLEERFIDLVYMALRDAAGQITGLLAHGVDQTDRRLAELESHASRERFQQIVSQAAAGVAEMDATGRFLFVNQQYIDMLGYTENELLGMNLLDVTASHSVELTREALAQLRRDGIGVTIEKQYRRKNGSPMPATCSMNGVHGANGDFKGIVAISLDITESKRTAEALRASEERYRTLFESMEQGFCIIDILFDTAGQPCDYRFIEMNAMFEHHTGLANGAGKTALELVPNLDRFWIDTYGKVAVTGKAVRFESDARAMGRFFEVYATRMGGPGSPRVALLFSDITVRQRDSETLRRLAADLSEADRRKTEFLATLAHELRNPLAPIRSGLSVMRMSEEKPAVVAKVRAMMERQVGHMVHLIDDLLDIARISGGKLQLKKTRAELGKVISNAIETSLPIIEAGQHMLQVDVPQVGFDAEVDVTRIAQVVANLLNNAAKYTPHGGKITLAMHCEEAEAVVSVSDTGVGIAKDALPGVFDMFSQIGTSLERAQGGLGIGLSLVRRLVEMHGGSVAAQSEGVGTGSMFTIRLPLAAHVHPSLLDASPELQLGLTDMQANTGLKILVVDDNVDAAMTLSMILELHGHTTKVAHNGLEAIEAITSFTPELAFLDIGMPLMNGYETAMAIRRLPKLDKIRLVALTGWGADSDRDRSKDAGFDYHLTKPVQISDIEHILRELSNSEK